MERRSTRRITAGRYLVTDVAAYAGRHRLFVEGVRPEMETGKPPILFVGGAFDGSWICRQQLDCWAERGYPSYALNLRGYYKSRYRHVASLTHRDYLDDILAACTFLRLENPILAGYSMGGILLQKFAATHGARALILYDSDWPRQVAAMIGERPGHTQRPPAVMNFWPPRRIVEEMMGRAVTEREYRSLLGLFKQSFLSGRAYRELEIERIEVDAAKITCPVLVICTSSRDRAQTALARYYRASTLVCAGHSHGSILLSRFHAPVTQRVAEWIGRGFPRWARRCVRKGAPTSPRDRRHRMKLFYFTGWEAPEVHVCDRRGAELSRVAMKHGRQGRTHDERIFEAAFPLTQNQKFFISHDNREDRPHGQGWYAPSGAKLYLMDGEFFPHPPPAFREPPAYFTTEIRCKSLAHHFRINVMLPRDYAAERGPYPVLVLNDGQNQWKNRGAYGGWHTDAIALDLARRGRCRDLVLVAIVSHPKRDFTYLPPPGGGADKYIDFLATTVLPALRKQIHISKDRREVGIIGASFGANCAVYAALKHPSVFGLAGSLSYAFLHDDPVMKRMRALRALPMARLYADCGTRWAYDQPGRDDHTSTTRELVRIAAEKGMVPGENLLGVIANGHYHNEVYWRKRIGRCLETLCPIV